MDIAVERVGPENAHCVLEWVERLLRELGEEGDEAGALDRRDLAARWSRWNGEGGRMFAFVATAPGGIAGVLTLVEAFAFYAGGRYGIINELIVDSARRSTGVGASLIAAASALGREREWARIDVAAPESERWARTRAFYERQGFVFTGPKLKLLLR